MSSEMVGFKPHLLWLMVTLGIAVVALRSAPVNCFCVSPEPFLPPSLCKHLIGDNDQNHLNGVKSSGLCSGDAGNE